MASALCIERFLYRMYPVTLGCLGLYYGCGVFIEKVVIFVRTQDYLANGYSPSYTTSVMHSQLWWIQQSLTLFFTPSLYVTYIIKYLSLTLPNMHVYHLEQQLNHEFWWRWPPSWWRHHNHSPKHSNVTGHILYTSLGLESLNVESRRHWH